MYILYLFLFINIVCIYPYSIKTKPSSSKYKYNIPLYWKIASKKSFTDNTPKRYLFNGFPIAIYKDNNDNITAISDICVHRGASLSRGKVLNNNMLS